MSTLCLEKGSLVAYLSPGSPEWVGIAMQGSQGIALIKLVAVDSITCMGPGGSPTVLLWRPGTVRRAERLLAA